MLKMATTGSLKTDMAKILSNKSFSKDSLEHIWYSSNSFESVQRVPDTKGTVFVDNRGFLYYVADKNGDIIEINYVQAGYL
jgi:hypothetical protein